MCAVFNISCHAWQRQVQPLTWLTTCGADHPSIMPIGLEAHIFINLRAEPQTHQLMATLRASTVVP